MCVWYVGREENNSFPYVMRKVLSYQDIIPYSFEYLMVLLSGFALSSSKRLIKAAGGERVSVFRWKYQIDGEIKQTKLDFTPDWCCQGHQTHCGSHSIHQCFSHMLENRPAPMLFHCRKVGPKMNNPHFRISYHFLPCILIPCRVASDDADATDCRSVKLHNLNIENHCDIV